MTNNPGLFGFFSRQCKHTPEQNQVQNLFDAVKQSARPSAKFYNSIKIEHINPQSLMGHFEETEIIIIMERNLDILCTGETWLHKKCQI